jgi:hypothetical protein
MIFTVCLHESLHQNECSVFWEVQCNFNTVSEKMKFDGCGFVRFSQNTEQNSSSQGLYLSGCLDSYPSSSLISNENIIDVPGFTLLTSHSENTVDFGFLAFFYA